MFKKLKLKEKKKKRKITQNCKSPTQRQRFIETIKNVTEKRKGKKKLKSLIRFHSGPKIDNYNRRWGEEGKRKRNPKNLQNKLKNKTNKCFS